MNKLNISMILFAIILAGIGSAVLGYDNPSLPRIPSITLKDIVTSVSSGDNCIFISPTTGKVVVTFNSSCAGSGNFSSSVNFSEYASIWITAEGYMNNVLDLFPTLDLRYILGTRFKSAFDSNFSEKNLTDLGDVDIQNVKEGELIYKNGTNSQWRNFPNPTPLSFQDRFRLINNGSMLSWSNDRTNISYILEGGSSTLGNNIMLSKGDKINFGDSDKYVTTTADGVNFTSNGTFWLTTGTPPLFNSGFRVPLPAIGTCIPFGGVNVVSVGFPSIEFCRSGTTSGYIKLGNSTTGYFEMGVLGTTEIGRFVAYNDTTKNTNLSWDFRSRKFEYNGIFPKMYRTSNPLTCNSANRDIFFMNATSNIPCYCNSTNYVRFDGSFC